jgi:hypothetical protein
MAESNTSYTIVAEPTEKHKCYFMSGDEAKRCKHPNWTIFECNECGTNYYWMRHETRRRRYFYKIGWWNQWRVDRHHR